MEKRKTNVLFIMVDQLKYSAIRAHGNTDVITPNLDKLTKTSCDHANYFANSPVCVPSRCSFITSKYPHSHGIRENHTVLEENREIHLFRILKQNGYSLAYSGKNHVLMPSEFENFDYSYIEGACEYSEQELECEAILKNKAKLTGSFGYKVASCHEYPKEATGAWKWTSHMIESLEHLCKDERPFCGFLSLVEPHYPHVAPKEIWDLYDEERITAPDIVEDDLQNKASRFLIKQAAQHSDQITLNEKKKWLRAYYSLITLVDMQVGRIVDWLEEHKKLEDTIIVFTSDHGEFGFEHGMYKKDLVLLDALLHVPMIISWPGHIAHSTFSETLAEEVDVLPTVLELLGLNGHRGIQGKSFAKPLLNNQNSFHKDEVFAEVNPPWLFNKFKNYEEYKAFCLKRGIQDPPFNIPGDFTKSIRTMGNRYVWYGNGEEELYDLINDPGETKNLSKDEKYKALKMELKMRLLEWNAKSENPIDPAINANLQIEYDCWKEKNYTNFNEWLPYWTQENIFVNQELE